jgi:hypothetical protein
MRQRVQGLWFGGHARWLGTADRRVPFASLAGGLDALRLRFLRACMPLSGALAANREARIAIGTTLMVLLACVITMVAPVMLLALGPILLGVPHLLADVRYCVVRTGWHRDRVARLAFIPIVATAFGAGLSIGLAAVGIVIVAARAPVRRKVIGLGIVAGLIVLTTIAGRWWDVFIVHVHNFVAVGLWLAWRRRQRRWHLVPLAVIGVCSVLVCLWPAPLGLGVLGSIPERHWFVFLAPGLSEGLALRLVLLFAFMQSVHYGLWLRAVPDEDRKATTPRTFRASLRALERDVGRWLVWLTVLGTVGLALWAAADLFAARLGYLRFARFHAVLEFCVAALLLVESRTIVTRRQAIDKEGTPS